MTTRGLIAWKKISKMLKRCLGEWWYEDKTHKRWVYAEGRESSFKLPLGPHGSKNPEIEIGHVRGMVRHFDIQECAEGELEQLR